MMSSYSPVAREARHRQRDRQLARARSPAARSANSLPVIRWPSFLSFISRGGEGADLAAVAQHRDALGDLHHLVEAVRDEHVAMPFALRSRDEREQRVDLVAGQRGGRLVHDDEPGVGRHGAADGDELAAGDRQIRDLGAGSSADADPRHRRLGGRAIAAPSRRAAAAPRWLPTAMFSATVRLGNSDRSW